MITSLFNVDLISTVCPPGNPIHEASGVEQEGDRAKGQESSRAVP